MQSADSLRYIWNETRQSLTNYCPFSRQNSTGGLPGKSVFLTKIQIVSMKKGEPAIQGFAALEFRIPE